MLKFRFILALVVFSLVNSTALALTVPRIFTDHMVLQRGVAVSVWGWADPGQKVEVSFGGQTKSATAAKSGKWTVKLSAMEAEATPSSMTISAGDKKITINNILVGEVWICSGQSNMEWTMNATHNAKEAIAAADYPLIRQFKVPHVINTEPQRDLPGEWTVCSPNTAAKFTGVGLHFGRYLQKDLDVPIGLINTSWGGTRIEPWTDPEGFKVSPKLKNISDRISRADETHRENLMKKLDEIQSWIEKNRAGLQKGGMNLSDPPVKMPRHPLAGSREPTAIYNAMVAPLVPYAIKGAIWYQGESNNGEGMLYYEKMRALISSWRRLWNQGDFPFLYVQLAPYRYRRPDALPGIWQAQFNSLWIPNTGMAVTTDIGNVSDIHPRNKDEVGRRLSLWALAKSYGKEDLVYSGPLYKGMAVDGDKAVLYFQHGEGLKSRDGKPLTWFSIAGPDGNFVEAKAEIDGGNVVVSSDQVEAPQAVRFGWNELAEPNLANGAGLPASPFRTDW